MISVCILTKNAARTLKETLDSLVDFDEVILLDNGSCDDTLVLAKNYPNVKCHTSPFLGFGPLRNQAAELATYDWILALDSDEVLSPKLIEEIQDLKLHPDFAYQIPRHNYFRQKRIRGCGWGGEKPARLYHKKSHRFCESQVHEKLIASKKIPLRSPILHTPYLSTSDFLIKMELYSTLFAKQYRDKKNSSIWKALFHAFYAFFRSYILKMGIFDGKEGLFISIYNANTSFYKHIKSQEK